MGQARLLVDRAWAAIETGAFERLDGIFAVDAELTTATGSGRGVEYVKGVFRRHVDVYPDMAHEVLSAVESAAGDAVALEIEFTGTLRGELRTPLGVIRPTGQTVRWRSADHVRTDGERIVSWHAHFDRLALLEQFGLTVQLAPAPVP